MIVGNASGAVTGVGDVFAPSPRLRRRAGGILDESARADVHVGDIGTSAARQAVRRPYCAGGAPAAALVEASGLVKPDHLAESDAIAAVEGSVP